jgi:hypothetical protein
MEVDTRNAIAVRLEDSLDDLRITDVGRALVVENDVITVGVIRLAINW